MKRDIDKYLQEWAQKPKRQPLILNGVRQVGKSYAVYKLAQDKFSSFLPINFEQDESYKKCFDSLKPEEILKKLEWIAPKKIIRGETLLFFDEIELCLRALQSLRYFEEQMPDLHVIAAGSLLEFLLEESQYAFPVGRVAFINLGSSTCKRN